MVQVPGIAYSVSGTSLEFTEAPLTGDLIDVRVLVTTQTISGLASPNGFNSIVPNDTDLAVWTGTTSSNLRWKFDGATGSLLPVGAMDIGSASAPVDNIFVSNVIVTGGSISGVSFTLAAIDDTVIGANTPAAGTFTTIGATTAVALTSAPITANPTAVVAGTSATVVDSFAAATYRTAKYVVSVTNGSNYQAAEVLVMHNGTNAYITTYADIATGATLVTFSADVVSGNVQLKATGTAAGNNIKVQKTYVAV